MIDIKLHTPIDGDDANKIAASWGVEEPVVFSLETLNKIFEENPDEKDFRFNIHCDGGSIYEGLAIYDKIRTSGKNIYCNIEGGCHSMAIVLLLAAPKENRTANANARALIHEVQVPVDSYFVSTTELESLTEQAKMEQDAILDIYAERTGTDRAVLENLMKEERVRTASELLQYGFISKINSYNTNKKNSKMGKDTKKNLVNQIDKFMRGVKNILGEPVNYDFTDANGNVILTTEREDETIEVGDSVVLPNGETSGEVTLQDGRTVKVADGVVTEVVEKEETTTTEEEIENLKKRCKDLEDKLAAANEMLKEARNQIASDYQPKERSFTPSNEGKKMTAEEIKAQARAKMK